MAIGDICVREVLVTERATTAQEAAKLMRQYHVGDLVVVDATSGQRVPVGIVTDRDIVISAVRHWFRSQGIYAGRPVDT
jgi:predicted transcriptional regulator